jgi:multidrug efflux system membrane fusion protein
MTIETEERKTEERKTGVTAAEATVPRGKPKRRWRRWIVVGVAVLVVGGLLWRLSGRGVPGGGKSAVAEVRPVPVAVATVVQKDVPIFLEGLGSVTALATVTVRSQVDGRLDKVSFVEGQRVKKGEVIAQIDPRPFQAQLHQAEATLARDQAQLRNARLNLERYADLRKQNLIAQQQVDDQQTQADQFAATVGIDSAQVETARLNLDYARITSPVDGVTGIRQVDPGNLIHANDAGGIVVITQLDPIAVLFTLPQDDLPRVAKAMADGELSVDALSRDGGTKLGTGKVLLVDNQINQTTATIRLKAIFPNTAGTLWPNQFVKARLLLTTLSGAIVVPTPAIQRGPKGTFVYVVGADTTVAVQPVEIDSTEAAITVLARGLKPGQQVVVDGQNQIRPGSKVLVRPAEGSGAPAAPQANAAP